MSNASIPDLLHPEPMQRIDLEHTKIALSLAFAGGVSGGTFSEALEKARVAPTTWDPKVFVPDLFLQQFVALCYRVRIGGDEPVVCAPSLIRLLSNPPSDGAIVEHRRAVLAELLASAPLRGATERLYTSICRLRTLLEGAFGRGGEANRRQLDILQTFKSIVDLCADGFVAASSGLSRLAAFGGRIRGGEPYRSLSDLLKYDDRLANLTLNVRVGADGRIRAFEVLKVGENEDNPFVSSPLRRWLSKIELFVRGYKFSEGEVMARLIDAVFTGIEDELAPLVQLLGDLEFYLGALGFHDTAKAAMGLAVSLPTFVEARAPRKLKGLFNPLLLAHGMKPVPCQLDTDRHDVTVLVTGPNSGGKTACSSRSRFRSCSRSVAASCRRARPSSRAPAARGVAHRATEGRPIRGAARHRARPHSRAVREASALFDGDPRRAVLGHQPLRGEEIFELVVQMLAKLGPQAFITTHFLAFAGRLERESGISGLRFLQVELGAEHRPTYQFTGGVAKTSLAAHAASRLGVTRDQLLSLVDRNTRAATGKEI
jgi:DNA mismatch repair protein MutS2